jgi:hypothetical protein
LFEPLIRLFETADHECQDEWLYSISLFFFGHRWLAGVCPLDGQKLGELAVDDKLKPLTCSLAFCVIGLRAAYGDVARAEAVRRLRATYNGEVGLMPNGQIPGLEFYEGSEPIPKSN